MEPYLGPHLTVGKDYMKIEIQQSEQPQLLQFNHMTDIKLPDHYNGYYLQ